MPRLGISQKIEGQKGGVEEGTKGAGAAIETIRNLINEEGERVDASLIGKPVFGKPAPQPSSRSSLGQAGTGTYSDLFTQLISTGYRASDSALKDAGILADNGPVHMARTWLAMLFVRLLKMSQLSNG